MSGYFAVADHTLCTGLNGLDYCQALFRVQPDVSAGQVKVEIRTGWSQNSMDSLPKQYQESDLKIHTDDGQVVGANDQVQVLDTSTIGDNCVFHPETITKK